MTSRTTQFFLRSSGALLLALALVLFLTNMATLELSLARDPILGISLVWLYWGTGILALVVAILCLFGWRRSMPLVLLGWLSVNLAVYHIGLRWMEGSSVGVLYGKIPETFGLPRNAAVAFGVCLVGYLTIGSWSLLLYERLRTRSENRKLLEHPQVKVVCPACGGHIQAGDEQLGREVPCPHCKATVVFRKPALLKMSCYFCKGHIEFPNHAVGEKMKCPHCKMDITLKLPA